MILCRNPITMPAQPILTRHSSFILFVIRNDNSNSLSNSLNSCEAKEYAHNHPLNRPTINWILIIVYCFLIELMICCISLWLHKFFVQIFILANVLSIVLSLKTLIRILIKCHQRYAPICVRRRCKCKPSCSEYALIALDKYFLPIAILKIYNRIMHTCRGDYKVDYP